MKKGLLFSIIGIIGMLISCANAQEKYSFVTIGTGGISGVYYPTGRAIARMVNIKKKNYGIRAIVESTGGSVFNVNAIMNGDLEFGIIQSDRQYQAVNGLAEWADKGPQKDLRAVFSIYPESVALVAAVDAGITSIQDVKGKRINIGNPGSGHRQNAIDALETIGVDITKDIQAEAVKASAAAGLLQDGSIDAFFYTVGHPSRSILDAMSGNRKVTIANITGIDALFDTHPYYFKMSIPVSVYPDAQNKKDVETFGVKATVVTSAKISDDIVYAITKEVLSNLEAFKKLHPAYATLTRENMLEGLSAPMHPGAIKYFKEIRLIQ